MAEIAFTIMVILPSFAVLFVVLASDLGATRAYVSLSWVPLTFAALVWGFRQLAFLGVSVDDLGTVARAVRWAVLAQAALGAALAVHASGRREPWLVLAAATGAVAAGYVLLG